MCATRLIGAEPNLVLWGGGNTSIKVTMPDHRGRETDLLWIKGTGSDRLTIIPSHFAPLRMDDLALLKDRLAITDEEMVSYQARCALQPGSPNPSIETLLHAFIPAPPVYHTHADSICALTDVSDSALMIKRVYRDEVALIPYLRPGFTLAKDLNAYCNTRNLLMVKITAEDAAEAVLFLAADRSTTTTGAMIPVDVGIKEAFPG